jgi:hypothetical protein
MLAKYDSHSPTPMRTLGDSSTGTDYPLPGGMVVPEPDLDREPQEQPQTTAAPPPDMREDSNRTVRAARLTYVQLPTPRSFTLDPSPTPSPPLGMTPPEGLRVVVVDDDALTRMLMTWMLERMGCRVVMAENGEVTLDQIVGIGVASPAPPAASLDLVGGGAGAKEETGPASVCVLLASALPLPLIPRVCPFSPNAKLVVPAAGLSLSNFLTSPAYSCHHIAPSRLLLLPHLHLQPCCELSGRQGSADD